MLVMGVLYSPEKQVEIPEGPRQKVPLLEHLGG